MHDVVPPEPPAHASDYVYDVFLSYRHGLPFGPWVRDNFRHLFAAYLEQALLRPPVIFWDETSIKPGDAWPHRIKRALALSRCLVPIWSPGYFISEWCVRECCVMLNREGKFGYRTPENPSGLVVPVRVFATEHLPATIQKLITETQYLDAQDYVSSVANYNTTPECAKLEKELKKWVFGVAAIVNSAPTWEQAWLTPSFVDDVLPPCEQSLRVPDPKYKKPSIA